MVDKFNFDLRPSIQPAPHPGFTSKEMLEDKRKPSELAEEFVGKKLEAKMSHVEFKAYLYAYTHVLIAR